MSAESALPRDCLGTCVSPGDVLITARGELLTAMVTPSSIWRRGAGIAVEDRKHVKTYRPASTLLRIAEISDVLPHALSEKDRALLFASMTEAFQEQRRAELKARRGFKHER